MRSTLQPTASQRMKCAPQSPRVTSRTKGMLNDNKNILTARLRRPGSVSKGVGKSHKACSSAKQLPRTAQYLDNPRGSLCERKLRGPKANMRVKAPFLIETTKWPDRI